MKKYLFIAVITTSLLIQLHPQEKRSAARTFLETREKSGLEAALVWFDGLDAEKAQQYLCEKIEFLNIAKEMKSFGYVKEAARFFEKAAKLIPQSSVIWENLGATYVRLLRKDEAVRCFQQAIAVDPKNRGAQEQLKMIDILLEDTRHETREKMRFRPGENTGLQGPYLGQRPPGLKPELFAPGIVSVFGSNENTVTLSPDGRELYFGKESGIWVCRWTEKGWTAPQNTGWPGYEMWISPESGKMYYTGYEPGIWVMERSGTGWGKPQKLVSNGMFSTLTQDETLYTTVFSDKGKANVGRYVKKDGKYEILEVLGPEINSPNGFDAHPNVALDGSFILFDRQLPEGNRLFISFRSPNGGWSPAQSLGAEFNGSVSTFSPDRKYLFFMKNRDFYWVSAKIIEELRPNESDKLAAGAAQPQEIFDAIKNNDFVKVKTLIERDSSVINLKDDDGNTPLHLAAEHGHIHIVELLLVKGADINAKTGFKRTPLHFAASSGHEEIVRLLIAKGAKINEIDSFILTPVFRAAYRGHRNIVEMMLCSGIDLNTTEKNGVTLLHAAAIAGNPELVEMLLDKGIDRNVRNRYGKTPLHFAASRGHKGVVELLLDRKADINLKSLDGRTPLHTAADCGQPEIVGLLKARGANTSPRQFTVPEGRYFGQKPPGFEPEIFAPAIISTDGYEFAITFSPDGKELYFTRREGEKNYPTNYLMVCRYENNRWTEPEIAAFSGEYFDFESHISPDGKRLYFGSLRPKPPGTQAKGDIWYMEKADHGWREPRYLDAPVNNGFAMYVTSSRTGNLYYTGADGLYCSYLKNGKYSEPEKLKDENNEYFSGAHPFIAPDESYLIFDSDPGLMISFRNKDGTWTKIKEMGIPRNMCPSVSPDGKYLFFARHGNIFWVSAKIIEELRPKE